VVLTVDALTMGLTSGNAMVASMSGSMMAPPTMMAPGAAYAASGGVALSFGDVTINTDMDMAVFEARVRNVVVESMNS